MHQQSEFPSSTARETVPEMEEYFGKEIKILDKGFIRLVDYMGSDSAIVQAARVSYGKGTKKRNEDTGLIYYLMRQRHTTPFEMCEIKLHIKLPIFVARQWIRHRSASVNEYSARYSILEKEFYVPQPAQLKPQSKTNKQGREGTFSEDITTDITNKIQSNNRQTYADYEWMLDLGVARELARNSLPVNIYTQWYWKINLHNLLHFIALRSDPHAQYEIRAYANAITEIVKAWVPISFAAFETYILNGSHFSKDAIALLRLLLNQDHENTQHNTTKKTIMARMPARELHELYQLLELGAPPHES